MTAPYLPAGGSTGGYGPRYLRAQRPIAGGAQAPQQQTTAPQTPQDTTPSAAGYPAYGPQRSQGAPNGAPNAAPSYGQRAVPRPPPPAGYQANPYRQYATQIASQTAPAQSSAPSSYPQYPGAGYGGGYGGAPPDVNTALRGAVLGQLENPSTYDSEAVQRSYGALSGQIDDQFAAKNRAIEDEMARRGLSVSTEADYRLKDNNAYNKSAHTQLADSLLTQQAQTLAQDRVNAAQLAQSYQTQQDSQGLARDQLALSGELGRGSLGVSQQNADTQRQQVTGQLGLADRQLGENTREFDVQQELAKALGLGNLDLQNRQLAQEGNQFQQTFGENSRQFNVQQDLAKSLGLGDLDLRNRSLTQSGAQFDRTLAEQQGEFGRTAGQKDTELANDKSAQDAQLYQSLAGLLVGIAGNSTLSAILGRAGITPPGTDDPAPTGTPTGTRPRPTSPPTGSPRPSPTGSIPRQDTSPYNPYDGTTEYDDANPDGSYLNGGHVGTGARRASPFADYTPPTAMDQRWDPNNMYSPTRQNALGGLSQYLSGLGIDVYGRPIPGASRPATLANPGSPTDVNAFDRFWGTQQAGYQFNPYTNQLDDPNGADWQQLDQQAMESARDAWYAHPEWHTGDATADTQKFQELRRQFFDQHYGGGAQFTAPHGTQHRLV